MYYLFTLRINTNFYYILVAFIMHTTVLMMSPQISQWTFPLIV